MVLKKKKRTAIGKMAMEEEYPKITFEQAIDLVTSAKSADGFERANANLSKQRRDKLRLLINFELDYSNNRSEGQNHLLCS